jgi:hypothetical protein
MADKTVLGAILPFVKFLYMYLFKLDLWDKFIQLIYIKYRESNSNTGFTRRNIVLTQIVLGSTMP